LAQAREALARRRFALGGDSDGIVDSDYGRAYAEAISGAGFRLLPDTGHMPQLETPDQVLAAIYTT
jgi:pimeloyl-ACP methyl ester carboxylesterase